MSSGSLLNIAGPEQSIE